MSDFAFNFIIRFIFFWLIGLLILQKDFFENTFFACFMAGGFLLLEKLLGSADIKKQDKKLMQLIAGNLKTKRDKLAWIMITLTQCIGLLFITAGLLELIFDKQPWVFVVGALVSLSSFFFMPKLAKKYLKK